MCGTARQVSTPCPSVEPQFPTAAAAADDDDDDDDASTSERASATWTEGGCATWTDRASTAWDWCQLTLGMFDRTETIRLRLPPRALRADRDPRDVAEGGALHGCGDAGVRPTEAESGTSLSQHLGKAGTGLGVRVETFRTPLEIGPAGD